MCRHGCPEQNSGKGPDWRIRFVESMALRVKIDFNSLVLAFDSVQAGSPGGSMPIAEYTLVLFTSFFTLINPLGAMPVFLGLTRDLQPRQRQAVALRAAGIGLAGLMLFALTGQAVFRFFSITVDSLRVAGGVIFFLMGYEMLQARLSPAVSSGQEAEEGGRSALDVAVTPLAIPMICGPGAITNAIVMWADAPTLAHKGTFLLVLTGVGAMTAAILLGASRILPRLGAVGNKVLMRLMGLIVMVIAVEFFIAGATPLVRRMLRIVG